MASAAQKIAQAYPKAGRSLAAKIVQVASRVGAHPYDLANLIHFESAGTFASTVKNPTSGATGLIQFMPATAKGLGTTTSALASMSPVQQMDWVERYLRPYKGRIGNSADLYMAVFYPAAIGKGPRYQFPPEVEAWNPGTKTPGDYARKADANARLPSTLGTHGPSGLLPALPSWRGLPARIKSLIRNRRGATGMVIGAVFLLGLVWFWRRGRRRRRASAASRGYPA